MPRWLLIRYAGLMRWTFARFYREFAWTYDVVAWLVSRGLWWGWIESALPHLRGRVLELGCGTGYMQNELATHPKHFVVGLDASPQMLHFTQRRLRRSRRTARLVRGVAQALPFPAASFDTVLATFPAEYILDLATAHDVRRVLAPGGQLLIVDGAQFTSDGVYERAVDAAYRATLQISVRRTPTIDRRVQVFEQAGFGFTAHWEAVGASRVLVLVGQVNDDSHHNTDGS